MSDLHRKLDHSQSLQHNAVQYQLKPSTVPIPTEILDRIVSLALTSAATPAESLVDRFSTIASLTLASFNFRRIALCRFLQILHINFISDSRSFVPVYKPTGERTRRLSSSRFEIHPIGGAWRGGYVIMSNTYGNA